MKTIKFTRKDGHCPSVEYNGTIYFIDERELRTSMEGWYLLSRQKTRIYDLGEDVEFKAVRKAMEKLESMGYGKTSYFRFLPKVEKYTPKRTARKDTIKNENH